jgi:hypothetical protein
MREIEAAANIIKIFDLSGDGPGFERQRDFRSSAWFR